MRFASVYRSFSSLADFEAEIDELRAAHARGPAGSAPAYDHDSEASHVERFAGAHDPAPPPVKVPATAAP